MIAPQEYVNIYSTRRVLTLGRRSGDKDDCDVISRRQLRIASVPRSRRVVGVDGSGVVGEAAATGGVARLSLKCPAVSTRAGPGLPF